MPPADRRGSGDPASHPRVATRRTRVVRRPTYVRGNVSAPSKHDAERDVARHSLLSNRDDVAGVVRRLIRSLQRGPRRSSGVLSAIVTTRSCGAP